MNHRLRLLPDTGIALTLSLSLWTGAAAYGQSNLEIVDAVRQGNLTVLEELLAAGTDADTPQGDGATALHWAAHRDDIEAARILITAGATVTVTNELGATPLWLASVAGSAEMVELLLDAGASPNVRLSMGETPLMSAARTGSVEVVEQLLAYDADVNAAEMGRHQTALMWAVAQEHPAVVRVLLEHGADIHARTMIWDQLENTAGNTNPVGNFRMSHGGSTPLLFAARNGDVETAKVLVDAGAHVNATAPSGRSALVTAAHSGHGALGVYLLEEGADPNVSDAGYTALHGAVLRSQVDLVKALLKHGADPNAILEQGTPGRRFSADYSLRHQFLGVNAFWLAAKYGELEILRILADSRGNPLVTPESGMSVLQAAMGVTRGTENRRNRVGVTLAERDDSERLAVELARVILGLGFDVNTADNRGDTALHYAVRQGFASVIELLAENGADLNVTNKRDESPLSLAEPVLNVSPDGALVSAQSARPSIGELLRRLGAVSHRNN